jgi:acyl-CoA synthetase (AMP-forming)/AMP-acid ligase II
MAEAKMLPSLTIGEVIVRGKNVSPSYLHRPDATQIGKIKDGDTLWHRMGDTGYLDAQGRLYFCGRKSHVVKAVERFYYSDPVERVFNEHAKVRRSALIGVRGGVEAAVAIEPLPEFFPEGTSEREQFVTELRSLAQKTPLTAHIEKFYFHPSFPVDARHNAKIFRDKLSLWAQRQGGEKVS